MPFRSNKSHTRDNNSNSGSSYTFQLPQQHLHGGFIHTTVTFLAHVVDEWVNDILFKYRNNRSLLVGLDTEWRLRREPGQHQPVVVLQLCIDRKCLVYQVVHAHTVPQSLVDFLRNPCFTFVGKCVKNDADKLLKDYGLMVNNTRDVADWAADLFDDSRYRSNSLKTLAEEFLGFQMEKDKRITLSRWDKKELSYDQIKYASFDAYVSCQLGCQLSKLEITKAR